MTGMLIDVTRCIGCEKCVTACVETNKLGKHIPAPQHKDDGLSANRWTSVVKRPVKRYVKKQCRHCLDPACVSACLVGAMQKSPEGPVVYDRSKCMGCRYCMMACPYGIPRYEWHEPIPYVSKCSFCHGRLLRKQKPACVEACPGEALLYGDREELLERARQTIRSGNGSYLEKIYGEKEVGGTSVMYISDIPLEFLGWSDHLGDHPLPELSWHSLQKVPAEFFGMGALMSGIYWVAERRRRLRGNPQAKPGRKDGANDTQSDEDRK